VLGTRSYILTHTFTHCHVQRADANASSARGMHPVPFLSDVPPCHTCTHRAHPAQLAINILIEFIQIAQIAMSPATVTFLYVDVLALRGSASPCVLPLAPLDGLAFRGSLPLFLFLILGIMMGVEVLVRGHKKCLSGGETCRVEA
jgi:hypothetical protein